MSLHSNHKFAQRFVRPLARKAGAPKVGNPLAAEATAELTQGWGEGTGMADFWGGRHAR